MVNDTTESFYFLFFYLFLYVMQLRHWVVEYETTAAEVVTNTYENVQSKSENWQKVSSYLKNNATVHFFNKLFTHLSICQILRIWSFDTI